MTHGGGAYFQRGPTTTLPFGEFHEGWCFAHCGKVRQHRFVDAFPLLSAGRATSGALERMPFRSNRACLKADDIRRASSCAADGRPGLLRVGLQLEQIDPPTDRDRPAWRGQSQVLRTHTSLPGLSQSQVHTSGDLLYRQALRAEAPQFVESSGPLAGHECPEATAALASRCRQPLAVGEVPG